MLEGLFLNSPKARCSIHESGRMIYSALLRSDKFSLDYQEVDVNNREIKDAYDFYAFNYHPFTMDWMDTSAIRSMTGTKIAFVLEVLPDNPFPMVSSTDFDFYAAVDPSMRCFNRLVSAFPRPLDPFYNPDVPLPDIPTIGSFGFATPGKGFDQVVKAANYEFDKAVVRINIPYGTHAGKRSREYAKTIEDECCRAANPGIDVQITHDYMSKEELIRWCAGNTLNCFLYDRNQPGLAATVDQAVSSGRPLAVSYNATFRHVLKYIKPFPLRTLKESIALSIPEVIQMQIDWTPMAFAQKFEELLAANNILTAGKSYEIFKLKKRNPVSMLRTKVMNHLHPVPTSYRVPKTDVVLFVSHKEQTCGIYQYGKNITNSLRKSEKYKFIFCECSSKKDLDKFIVQYNPIATIYNYYPATTPWITSKVTRSYSVPQLGIIHEFNQTIADATTNKMFDYSLYQDPDLEENNRFAIRTKQLVYPYLNVTPDPILPTIGSFGFGAADKGFEYLIKKVQEEFDTAIINIHMPYNDIVDPGGNIHANKTAQRCRDVLYKSDVTLNITHHFMKEPELLDFLAGNTINCFFTDVNKTLGISGAIHHALAAHRPVAITKCLMYRDILKATPSICIEDSSLKQIIKNGLTPLEPFYKMWSEEEFIKDYERILDKVLS